MRAGPSNKLTCGWICFQFSSIDCCKNFTSHPQCNSKYLPLCSKKVERFRRRLNALGLTLTITSDQNAYFAELLCFIFAGHKISGVRFRLDDGEHHIVDSSEYAFMMAAQGAVKQCYERGNWQILEPIMTVEITAPEEYQGQVSEAIRVWLTKLYPA